MSSWPIDEPAAQHVREPVAGQDENGRLIAEQLAPALAEDTIAQLQAEAGRRYAERGAKRTSPIGAIDAIPISKRVRKGKNGEIDPDRRPRRGADGGIPGVVTYVEPKMQKSGTGTIKVM